MSLQGKPVPHRYEEGLVGVNGKAYFFGGDDWQVCEREREREREIYLSIYIYIYI